MAENREEILANFQVNIRTLLIVIQKHLLTKSNVIVVRLCRKQQQVSEISR